MTKVTITAILFTMLRCGAAGGNGTGMVYDFNAILISANLTWTPCFDTFTCAKLQVPLDYANEPFGTTSIAFLKMAGKNATEDSPSIVLIPGGPGGSGVDLLRSSASLAGQALGDQYNIVSFDPRGVGSSGPKLDCFSGNADGRLAFNRLHRTGLTNISSTTFAEQFYSSSIYGEWCNNEAAKDSNRGYYVTTPAVARDLITFTEAEAALAGRSPSDAQLWAYAVSYGTVIGATFASLFPDRVGRMVLDGVVDAEQYYDNDWRDNFDKMDAGVETFSALCHAAGPEGCALYEPLQDDITDRLDKLLQKLRDSPVPLSRAGQGMPTLVTEADLKAYLVKFIYKPLATFTEVNSDLQQVESGNVSAIAGKYAQMDITTDPRMIIQSVDSYRRNKLTTIEQFKEYVEYTMSKSKYFGDFWHMYLEGILSRSFQPNLPDSMMAMNPISALEKPTAYPLLFTSNTIDPVSPLIAAERMQTKFSGSVLLMQEAVGHTVIDQGGSLCYFGHVQAYFAGVVPDSNITCAQ